MRCMHRILPLLVLLAALLARGEQTKWIYRNPSTGGGTLVDDSDENHTLKNVRLTEAGATTIRVNRSNGASGDVPWSPRTRTAAQPWADFADEYNRSHGEIELPTRRYGVGTIRRTGKSATEYVAYWLPDLDPVTIVILR